MHGVTITQGPEDWEVIQQENGFASVHVEGVYQVHEAALEVGVEKAIPRIRVLRESDNFAIIPWRDMTYERTGQFSGTCGADLQVPTGGPYRLETCLETQSTTSGLTWLFRGDCLFHLCAGDVFVIAGQSNAAGYSRDYCPDAPHLCVHLYRNRGKWDLAVHPMNESTHAGSLPNEEMGIPGVSPYLSFGKVYYERTGIPVGLIQTALGGSPMKRWAPEDGDLYRNMQNKLKETGGKYRGMLWYQGCSDTDAQAAAAYETNFQAFVQALRESLGYTLPIFTFQLNRQINGINDEGWGMVREAQRRASLTLEQVYILPTTNCSLSDGIHNSAQANLVLGEKLAMQCAGVFGGKDAFEAPALDTAGMASAEEKTEKGLPEHTLRLTFSHVRNCFLIFSGLGQESGFTLEDAKGTVQIHTIRSYREDGNVMYLELERQPLGPCFISFAWQADPVKLPPLDEVTYLPPLSFYRVPILQTV